MVSIKRVAASLGVLALAGCVSVPAGMVSHFNAEVCPVGWTPVDEAWQGRYVVIAGQASGQVVGQALTPGENRATGDHGHSAPGVVVRHNCTTDNSCVGYEDRGPHMAQTLQLGSATPRNAGETVRPGTNAPYVALRTCVKS